MNVIARPRPKISDAEMQRRREIVAYADAHNRIEGLQRSEKGSEVFDAFIRGDIELTDMIPRLKALHNVPR